MVWCGCGVLHRSNKPSNPSSDSPNASIFLTIPLTIPSSSAQQGRERGCISTNVHAPFLKGSSAICGETNRHLQRPSRRIALIGGGYQAGSWIRGWQGGLEGDSHPQGCPGRGCIGTRIPAPAESACIRTGQDISTSCRPGPFREATKACCPSPPASRRPALGAGAPTCRRGG